jgi:hypothetical protein
MARLNVRAASQFSGAWWTPRRASALLGIFAILFQAMLFAWHHHAVLLPSRDAPVAGSVVVFSSDHFPAGADDDCPLCFALAHHNVTQVDFFTALLGFRASQPPLLVAAAARPLPYYLLFRSRAPPLA